MSKGLNINSALVAIATAIILAVLTWVGVTVLSSHDQLTKIEASSLVTSNAIADLKTQIGTLITRAEFEAKMSEIKQEQARIKDDLLRVTDGRNKR